MRVRKALHALGFRYRLHVRKLPGSPDIVLPKYHLAIFVHGCFWHRHSGCRFATTLAQNRNSWLHKFNQNIVRDNRQIQCLIDKGWRVLVIWECGLKLATLNLLWLPEHIKSNHASFAEWPE